MVNKQAQAFETFGNYNTRHGPADTVAPKTGGMCGL